MVELKKNHAYYYQIQGQMFCSGLRKGDLVVWFGDNQPLFIQSIMYDEHFVQKLHSSSAELLLSQSCITRILYKACKKRSQIIPSWWLGEVFFRIIDCLNIVNIK